MVLAGGKKSVVRVIGKGEHLALPALPLGVASTISVQVQGNGTCYETVFPPGRILENTNGKLKAKLP